MKSWKVQEECVYLKMLFLELLIKFYTKIKHIVVSS